MEDWLTMREVGERLGRSVASVGVYRRFCGLPAIKRGSQWYAKVVDVEEWRSRPEIAAMLAAGERRNAVRQPARAAAV